jgi:phosphoenolpyruvate carboxykinase (ATP)
MRNARIPCVAGHPTDIIFLTCDAFGVLPPVARLTPEQAMYYFISGYTAKVAGTEMGVNEPEATFSPCFGGPFLVWHPGVYAKLLADKVRKFGARVWLVNTGWSGGSFGTGSRMPLRFTAQSSTAFTRVHLRVHRLFATRLWGWTLSLPVPGSLRRCCSPAAVLRDSIAYESTARKLAERFRRNFEKYADAVDPEIVAAGPPAAT